MEPVTYSDIDDDPTTEPGRRILVVDDSKLQLQIVSSLLTKAGFEVMSATSGEEALAICKETPPDIVVSDWMMPGMDGLELCRHFRALPRSGYGYFILLTSKNEKQDIARGLDEGADDFLTKPVNASELRARVHAGDRIVMMERQMAQQNRLLSDTLAELQKVHEAIDADLRQARTIQESLIPERSRVFGSTRVSLLLKPCGHVGGDLVGMFSPSDSSLGVYGIDVSGHGITSAMVTARVAGYLSSTFPDQNVALERRVARGHTLRSPAETAHLLNQRLAADAGVEEYLTLGYCSLDLKTGAARLVQAGHPPPLLMRVDGSVEFIGDGGMPIGLIDRVSHEETSFDMQKGDKLLIYSDGFTEAELKDGTQLGETRFANLVRQSAEQSHGVEMLEDLFWRLTTLVPDADALGDDISAALVEYDALVN